MRYKTVLNWLWSPIKVFVFNSVQTKLVDKYFIKQKNQIKIKLILTSPKPENIFGANFFQKNINVYSSYTLAKLIPIGCIKCLEKIKKTIPNLLEKLN